MNKTKSYLFAFLLGILTVIICLAIGDGMIGVAGTLGDCVYDEDCLGPSDVCVNLSALLGGKTPAGKDFCLLHVYNVQKT